MAKTISFRESKDDGATSLRVVNRKCACRHPAFEIDIDAHKVTCRDCGAPIDPFIALVEFAEKQRHFVWQIEKYKAAQKEFYAIQSEWSLTQKEKRRISRAMENVPYPESGAVPME